MVLLSLVSYSSLFVFFFFFSKCGLLCIRKRRYKDRRARENIPKCTKYETCQLTNIRGPIMVSNYEQNTHTILF